MSKSKPPPESTSAGAAGPTREQRRAWTLSDFLRAFVTKLVILIIIFITVPTIVYDQLRAADAEQKSLLLDVARQQGRMVAEILRPRLGKVTPQLVSELSRALGALKGVAIKTKLLYRPRSEAAADNFFYVASFPAVTTDYLERERMELVERGILARVRATCETTDPIAERYVNPSGEEEILTSVTPINTESGCWVVIASHTSTDFVDSSIGQPYWKKPEIRAAAVIYLLMAVFATLLYLDAWSTFSRFRALARAIGAGRRDEASFAELNRVPELAGIAREFDRLVNRLRDSAMQILHAAEENAHAFKTPIAVIAQSLEPLRRLGAAHEGAARAVGRIEQSVARLDALVTAARRMDEVTAELVNPSLRRIELLEPVKRIVESYDAARVENGPIIALRVSATPSVNADDDVLETVIENVLDNAISFSPPGGEVTIALDVEGADTIITVDDDGPGVPAEKLDRVFDRYYTDRQSDGPNGGAGEAHFGIGLWIARRNIEAIGGAISAANRPQGGLRVRLRLPSA